MFNVADKKQKTLNAKELLILFSIYKSQKVNYSKYLQNLLEIGLVEKYDSRKYVLSKAYYDYSNQPGEYTRKIGLDKNTNMTLIIEHLKKHNRGMMKDFIYMFRTLNLSKITINRYLSELRVEGKIEFCGNPRISRGKNQGYWKLKQGNS